MTQNDQLYRGDTARTVRDGEGSSGTVHLTGAQGEHIIALGPRAGVIRSPRDRQCARARGDGAGPCRFIIGVISGGQRKGSSVVGELQGHCYIHQRGIKNLPTDKEKSFIIQIACRGIHETRNGGVRGGRDRSIRDRKGESSAIKSTRVQRYHVVHLWPCPGGIGTEANQQNARAETVTP